MDTAQIKSIVEEALRDPRNLPWLSYVLVFIAAVVGALLGPYLKRKGENLATKEDVTELTHLVENVRTQYAERLENLAQENRKVLDRVSREHQLRLAALDRRLETHQQAFTLWRKLKSHIYGENIGEVVMECQTWWNANCLYLDPDAREAFVRAYLAASLHKDLLAGNTPAEDIKENWEKIEHAGAAIETGASLPPIKD